jgi:chromodomain-helicase-DNA-binding protein 4
MGLRDHVSDSESSEDDLFHTSNEKTMSRERSLLRTVLFQRVPDQPEELSRPNQGRSKIAVVVPAPSRPWEYQPYHGATTVDKVLEEIKKPGGQIWYKIEYEDGRREDVSMQRPILPLSFCCFIPEEKMSVLLSQFY